MSAPETLFNRHVPFLDLLEIRPVAAAEGTATFECVVQPKHLRTLGIVHGGLIATLLDTAMGYAAGTKAPENHYLVTAQLNLHFTKAAMEGERLTGTGTVQHAGRRTAVVLGEIRNDANDLVALATATFLYLPKPVPKEC